MSLAIKAGRMSSQGGMAGRVRSGDPGLWSSIKKIGGAVAGFVTGGPVGAIAGYTAASGGGGSPSLPISNFGTGPGMTTIPVKPTPGFAGAAARALPGGKTGYEVQVPAGGKPSGYRLNKSGYFLRDGTYVAPGTKWVKIRRRNSMNPRALSRAISRVDGGKAIQHKLAQITTAKYTAAGNKK